MLTRCPNCPRPEPLKRLVTKTDENDNLGREFVKCLSKPMAGRDGKMENWGSSDRGAGRVVPMARYLESELTNELKKIKKNQREMIDLQKQANIMAVFLYCCVIALFMFYLLFIVIRGAFRSVQGR
uniref:Zinc finger GRF-type domain-containing protein n=1 Tax=Hordeum vulgare subsp. vulgare TaxID=112509 RepID=A0A8I6XYP6_HORVV